MLLVNHHPIGGYQYFFQPRIKIPGIFAHACTFLQALAGNIVIHHAAAQRAGAVQCHQGNHVIKAIGFELHAQVLGTFGFRLKHRHRVACGKDVKHGGVGKRQTIQLEIGMFGYRLAQIFDRQLQNSQIAQAQKIKFHQACGFNIVFIKLRHGFYIAAVFAVHRAKVGHFSWCNEHTARMHTYTAGHAFNLQGNLENCLRVFFLGTIT